MQATGALVGYCCLFCSQKIGAPVNFNWYGRHPPICTSSPVEASNLYGLAQLTSMVQQIFGGAFLCVLEGQDANESS